MNNEEPYRDQAERLRQKIERIQNASQKQTGNEIKQNTVNQLDEIKIEKQLSQILDASKTVETIDEKNEEIVIPDEIDRTLPMRLNKELPKRGLVHQSKSNKTKWKLKYPVIRLLVLFFILLPVTIFSVYSYLGDTKLKRSENVSIEKDGFEEINVQPKQDSKQDKQENEMEKETAEPNSDTQSQSNEPREKVNSDKESIQQKKQTTNSEQISQGTEKQEQGNSTNKIIYHTVQSNETLYRIAIKYYQSKNGIEIIREANNLANNEIMTGQLLKIPL